MIHREVGVKTVFSSWSCESSQVNLLQKSLLSQHEEHGRITALEQQVSLYDKPLFFFVIWRVSTVCVLLYNNIYNIANPLDSFFFVVLLLLLSLPRSSSQPRNSKVKRSIACSISCTRCWRSSARLETRSKSWSLRWVSLCFILTSQGCCDLYSIYQGFEQNVATCHLEADQRPLFRAEQLQRVRVRAPES